MTVADELGIAIVGMAGRFPGARNLDEFWHNLAAGIDSITRLADEEMLRAGVPASYLGNPRYVKVAPVLERPERFDARFFGFSPTEARSTDPQHRILLELAHEALEHAGYDPDRYRGRIGVYTGAALNTYFTAVGLNERLAEEYIATLIGNDKDFLSTRISYKLNLKGPSITVQTACSTSMVAVHLACQSLLSEETDMALAGAISVRVPHRAGYFCDNGGVASADGVVRAFDAKANGTVFGSGGGVLVLKRLTDARADGDTVHAVIKGSAVNNDGAGKAGYTAPSIDSQSDAVIEALANAGVEADSIGYLEAHGSGTPVGDPIEIRALTKAFRAFTQRCGYCAIGSVKTNVGHLDAAAGMAGIMKTVLALKHRQLPPSLHFTEANPEIDFPSTPFYVNTRLREWPGVGPRRAGVMSTGMGGTNAHVIVEEAPEPTAPLATRTPQLLIWSAKTESALEEATERLAAFLDHADPARLGDVAYTLQTGRKPFAYRRCLVCAEQEDAVTALRALDGKRIVSRRAAEARRPVILLLPGVGDHYVGMGHGLYEAWPVFRQAVDRCARVLEPQLGVDIRDVIYPPGGWRTKGESKGIDLKMMLGRGTDARVDPDAAKLNQTLFAQPALFTIEYAMTALWQSLGITPAAIVGHSMGEYVAACVADVLSLEDALRLVATRAKLVNELPQGAMLAVALSEEELRALLPEGLSIALINGPRLCVVAGPVEAVAGFTGKLNDRGIICRPVQNAHAFHSRMLDSIAGPFTAEAKKARFGAPRIPYISNVTGSWIGRAEATNADYWAAHATRTARFDDALQALWRFENPILLEAGPGRTLGVLAMQHPARRDDGDPLAVPSIRHEYENESDVEFLWRAVGALWLAGADIRWDGVPRGGPPRRVPLPTYPFEGEQHWLEPLRNAAGPGQSSVHKNRDPAEWIYVPSWKRVLPRSADLDDAASKRAGQWLVFADDTGLGPVLIKRLRAAGHDVISVRAGDRFERVDARAFTIEPGSAEAYDALIRALLKSKARPARVVHAWSLAHGAASDRNGFAQAQARGFHSLLLLARALAAHNVRDEIELFVLSAGVQDVCGTETLCPEKSTVLGPSLVIRQEYPNIRVRSVDIDAEGARSTLEAAADLVLGELLRPDSSLFIAHRNAQRWVQVYERVELGAAAHGRPAFRAGGVYLITGGLGRIGIAISEYLAAKYQARLVLVGRSSLASWKARAVENLEALGAEVSYASANVADERAMQRVVEQAHRRFGALHGVIHGAGIVGDGAYREINDHDPDHSHEHFQAKASGLGVLERVLDGEALDFCLLLSSLTSVLGGIGQAAYASSNIYMDTFARRHNRTSPVHWLSVNWDVWRVHEDAVSKSGLGTTLKDLGMSAAEATAVMEAVLRVKTASQLVVSTGDLGARIDQWIELKSLLTEKSARAARPTRSSATLDAPRDAVERQVAEIWQDALGIDAVGVNDSFAELGGHSLMAVRIVAELRRTFETNVPVRALFDAPTVAELARYIREQIVAEVDALTDDEARKLVSN